MFSLIVSCKIWEGVEVKKVDLSVLDISSAVISKVDCLHHTTYYLQFGKIIVEFQYCMVLVILDYFILSAGHT